MPNIKIMKFCKNPLSLIYRQVNITIKKIIIFNLSNIILYYYHILKYDLRKGIIYVMKTEVGWDWYQSIHFDELSWRQVSFSGPKWTSSREEHFDAIRTGWVSKHYSVGLIQLHSISSLLSSAKVLKGAQAWPSWVWVFLHKADPYG